MSSIETYDRSGVAPAIAEFAIADERAAFIRRTYLHLAGAILLFVALEAFLLNFPPAIRLAATMVGSRFGWFIVLAAFMAVGHVANKWAISGASPGKQYAGLILYVVAESIIFLPLLLVCMVRAGAGLSLIYNAGLITGALFLGLTVTALGTRKDFSFLGSILGIGSFVAMGIIVASLIFGFNLGLLFSGFMVVFAGGAIIYTTSNVMRHYRTDQHVAASLALFAAVALLFWYVLRILMSMNRR